MNKRYDLPGYTGSKVVIDAANFLSLQQEAITIL